MVLNLRRRMAIPMWAGTLDYIDKVLGIQTADQIAYWPTNEASGVAALDYSAEGNDGVYNSDVSTWPVGAGIGDGNTAPIFDGSNDFINVHSAGLASDLDFTEFTVAFWLKPFNVGVWTDGVTRYNFIVDAGGGKRYAWAKVANNTIQFAYRSSVAVDKNITISAAGWSHFVATVSESAGEIKVYLNGTQSGITSVPGAWTYGATIKSLIGSYDTSPNFEWHGQLPHLAIWTMALGQSAITSLATV